MLPQRVVLHPKVAPAGRLRVWLGVLWERETPDLRWLLDGRPAAPEAYRPLTRAFADYPSHQLGVMTGLYDFPDLQPGSRHCVTVHVTSARGIGARAELTAQVLPRSVGDSFTILLASCFANQTDPTGIVGQIVDQLVPAPDLSLLSGDQVYLDQPLFRNWSSDPAVLAARFEDQYVTNWMSSDGGSGLSGYGKLLHWAPSASLPDDHEYWNNFPRVTPVVPASVDERVRRAWTRAASDMYDAFQRLVPRETCQVIDVEPLSICLLDTRTDRSADSARTVHPDAMRAFCSWSENIWRRSPGRSRPTIPVLVTGPSVFQPPKSEFAARFADSNLANYSDYRQIRTEIHRLAEAGYPVLLLSGDVHYPRVIRGGLKIRRDGVGGGITEVISSPTSLVRMPLKDQLAQVRELGFHPRRVFDFVRSGQGAPAARWKPTPLLVDGDRDLWLAVRYPAVAADSKRGDHVALLTFGPVTNTGVTLTVRYVAIPKRETAGTSLGVDDALHLDLTWDFLRRTGASPC